MRHGSYRIADKWGNSKLYVTAPNGAKIDITANVFDAGEANDVSPAGQKGYFAAAFVPGSPGLYAVSVEGDSIFTYPDGRANRTLRSAKTYVAAADIPLRERVEALTNHLVAVAPDRAELIPQVNPIAVTAGQALPLQLVHQGPPVVDQEITVVRRSTGEDTRLQTDANGMVTITELAADFYLVRAKFDGADEKVEGEYDKVAYEATLTFQVQCGGQAALAFGSKTPAVMINGRALQLAEGYGTPRPAPSP